LIFYGGAVQTDPYARAFFDVLAKSPWCRYVGFADQAGLRTALARATMLVLPSLEDNCPMSVLEAMAAEVPVAAANVGGVPELLTHGIDGLLFDPCEDNSIRGAIEELLTDSAKAATLATNAKERALRCFHPRKIAEKHLEIYRQVIASGAAHSTSAKARQ